MKKLLQYGVALAAAGLLANTAIAQPVLLSSLLGGQEIQIGDKIFDDFAWTTANGVAANQVTVTLGQSPGGDYFIEFQGAMSSGVGTTVDIGLHYSVRTSSGLPLIAGIDQAFTLGVQGNGGIVNIGETAWDGGFHVGNAVAQSSVGFIVGAPDPSDPAPEIAQGDHLTINPTLSKVWITKDIELIGNAGGIVGATVIHQSFHQVSVPDGGSTLLLLGSAMSCLSFFGLRRKS